MTQITFKNDIDQNKIDALLHFLRSWDIDAEVSYNMTEKKRAEKDTTLTLSVGLWEGRDINDKQLREQAWGTCKRLKQ